MPSYQDIESRLRSVEDKLEFLMTTMRMRAAIPTGLLDERGEPAFRVFDGTMKDHYLTTRTAEVLLQQDSMTTEETTND